MCIAAQPLNSLVLFLSPRCSGDRDPPLCPIPITLICLCPYLLADAIPISSLSLPFLSLPVFVSIPILVFLSLCLYPISVSLCPHLLSQLPSLSLDISFSVSIPVVASLFLLSLSLPFFYLSPCLCLCVHLHLCLSVSLPILSVLPSLCLPLCVPVLVQTPAGGRYASLASAGDCPGFCCPLSATCLLLGRRLSVHTNSTSAFQQPARREGGGQETLSRNPS